MMHQPVVFQPPSVSLNGICMNVGDVPVKYWGIATLQPNGKYHCYANVAGSLCVVEVNIRFAIKTICDMCEEPMNDYGFRIYIQKHDDVSLKGGEMRDDEETDWIDVCLSCCKKLTVETVVNARQARKELDDDEEVP